ncbi:MAG: DUF2889 domain-containing protein [Blastocatellia bacterium]
MSLRLSFPLETMSYLRTFDAEIDILTDNEILVRGVMTDHRFGFEHVWRVRTPEYEVLDARAAQIAGAKGDFDPGLCERYAGINGVRVGRGFSKRVITALGDLPGAREHLLLSIEMARVAQQVYQFPPEFLARFQAEPASAELSWIKDRAYMGDLANSCYTYRDASAELFAAREVRVGFGEDLYQPKPGDKRAFWRNKMVSVELTPAGYLCESAMEDRIHDIRIGFDLSREGVLSNARSRGLRLPYHGICEDAQLRTAGLDGMKVTAGFILQFADRVGGSQGCTHLFDLSVDALRLFDFVAAPS